MINNRLLQIIIEAKENLVDDCRLRGSTERHIAKCDDWHNVLTPTKEKKINCVQKQDILI